MRALVIYDTTGRIWNIVYGQGEIPQGLTCMWVDIPDGAVLERIDATDPENPKAVFSYLPESDIGRLQKKTTELDNQLMDAYLALTEQYETSLDLQDQVTNTMMALTELYESM